MTDDDALLAGVLRRLLRGFGGWSLTYRDLTINAALDDLTAEERAAVGRATGKATIEDPLLRGVENPTPADLAVIARRRADARLSKTLEAEIDAALARRIPDAPH